MTSDPTSVEGTCVALPEDYCVQVPWECINVCGYSDQFCKFTAKLPQLRVHGHTYICTTGHTTYRMSDHIVSF